MGSGVRTGTQELSQAMALCWSLLVFSSPFLSLLWPFSFPDSLSPPCRVPLLTAHLSAEAHQPHTVLHAPACPPIPPAALTPVHPLQV